jgi:hypothetical protein
MRYLDFTRPVRTKEEVMQAYNKKYREKHSNEVICGCGGIYKAISCYTHKKSAKHLEFIRNSKPILDNEL